MGYGVYLPLAGPLHRADPAMKILSLVAWFAVGLLLTGPAGLSSVAGLTLIVAAMTGLLPSLARFWKFMSILFFTFSAFWILFSEGGVVGWLLTGVWRCSLWWL